ncbi:MAG TPA: hypothetical protein DDZ42_15055 [Candidatus Rokubacteria bacterium]|nr:hypothetical protein [Candidatus Rokubacteria bacterium]
MPSRPSAARSSSWSRHRALFRGGLLVRRRRSVPYHKITDLEVTRTLLDQLLGIGTLRIYTARRRSSAS